MQCYNCGRERPRTGDCPYCGAPAQNSGSSYSSMRNWRDQASSSGSRNSRPNPNDPRPPISRPVDPSRSRGSGANWGSPNQSYPRRSDPNQSYPRRNDPNQSYPRRGDPNQSYSRRDSYDDYGADDRALMVPPDMGGLMPMDDRALPALPTEEEERALGIRRPAFIPATDERKGGKPGRWRVISGVLSIMLLCVAACGVSGFLVRQNLIPQLSKLLGISRPSDVPTPNTVIPTPFVSGAPLVTPVPAAHTPIQSDIKSYNLIKASQAGSNIVTPENPTSLFYLGQYIYVVMNLNSNVKAGDKVSAEWFFNTIDITPDLQKSNPQCCSRTVAATGKELQVYFSLKPTTTGGGSVQIKYNGQLAYTILFYVAASSPATPTPLPAKPTVAPTKHP